MLALFVYCLDSFLHLKPMHKISKIRGLRGGHKVGLKMVKQTCGMPNNSQRKEGVVEHIEFHRITTHIESPLLHHVLHSTTD